MIKKRNKKSNLFINRQDLIVCRCNFLSKKLKINLIIIYRCILYVFLLELDRWNKFVITCCNTTAIRMIKNTKLRQFMFTWYRTPSESRITPASSGLSSCRRIVVCLSKYKKEIIWKNLNGLSRRLQIETENLFCILGVAIKKSEFLT